jgi:hypothetical protein
MIQAEIIVSHGTPNKKGCLVNHNYKQTKNRWHCKLLTFYPVLLLEQTDLFTSTFFQSRTILI